MAQAPDLVDIDVDIVTPPAFPVLGNVGSVYEVAINGVGYMLAEHPEQGIEYERNTVGLDPERLATTETPFSQAIERYTFSALDDFSGGAGQSWADRQDSDPKRYEQSDGVDPFLDEGYVSLLNDVEEIGPSCTYDDMVVVVGGDNIYLLTDDNEITYSDDGGATWESPAITITDGAAGTVAITGLTSDGESWYAASGDKVLKGTTADPAAIWSTENAADVQWAAGRICAAVKEGSSSTPNRFTTLGPDGTEERTGGHLDLPEGHTVVLGGVARGFYFFGAYAGDKGSVYAWPLGTRDDNSLQWPFVAWDLPDGMIPSAVGTAGGSVWVRAYQPTGSSVGQASLYRLVVEGSSFVPFFVCDIETQGTAVDQSIGAFASYLDTVWFSWPSMEPTGSGIGSVNLKTGGWAESLVSTLAGPVRSLAVHQGRVLFTVDGAAASKLYAQDLDAYVEEGNLTKSITDGASALDKVFDDVTVVCDPLAAGESVLVQYSTDQGGTWQTLGTIDTEDATKQTWSLGIKSATLQLRMVLYGDGTTTPRVTLLQSRYHPLGLSDTLLVLPVDCTDRRTGLNGAPLPENKVYQGINAARTLEGLVQTRVQIQDIDWHVTGSIDTYELLQAQAKVVGLYDRTTGGKNLRTIMMLTMRKSGAS